MQSHQDFKENLEFKPKGETGPAGETQQGVICIAVKINVNVGGIEA